MVASSSGAHDCAAGDVVAVVSQELRNLQPASYNEYSATPDRVAVAGQHTAQGSRVCGRHPELLVGSIAIGVRKFGSMPMQVTQIDTSSERHTLSFDVIAETLRATNLGRLREGSTVNFERCLFL